MIDILWDLLWCVLGTGVFGVVMIFLINWDLKDIEKGKVTPIPGHRVWVKGRNNTRGGGI